MSADNKKQIVKEQYAKIATQSKAQKEESLSCCGGDSFKDFKIFSEEYKNLEGYQPDADLGVGCGLPTEFAKIKPGDTVVDLGSGAGNDCFVARAATGPTGKVIGIDFTDEMIARARANADKAAANNVEFRLGDIENLPITDQTVDVVVSNCVLNLVPDKAKTFKEIFRILKPGAHFSVSDMILKTPMPEALKNDAAMYAGCISSAILETEYMNYIKQAGFEAITIQKERKIELPESMLAKYLNDAQVQSYLKNKEGVYSMTIFAQKPQSQSGTTQPEQESTVAKWPTLDVKVLGTGCPSCEVLFERTKMAMEELQTGQEPEKISDLQKIIETGVLSTPALMINGKIESAGQLISKKMIADVLLTYKNDKCCG